MPDQTTTQRAETIVRTAYEWILGRDADESGLRDHGEGIASGRINEADLRRLLLSSPEFKRKQEPLQSVDIGNGLRAVVNPEDPEFGQHIARYGEWETHIVGVIRSRLRPGDVFVDIGGNLGLMSFNAAQVVGPSGKVIAFEPNPRNVGCFRRGLVLNQFENILVYPLAASDRICTLTTTTASNAKVVKDVDPLTINDIGQAVPVDFILRDEPRVDFIKIDIEGYELLAFKGMDATLRRHKPLVLTEFNPLCLRGGMGMAPEELADHIFSMTERVEIVEHDFSLTSISSTTELMSLWDERDRQAQASGRLPAGWVHFDLLFRSYGAAI